MNSTVKPVLLQREEVFIDKDVLHLSQRSHWDCGLTCILMIMNESQRTLFLKDFHKICLEDAFGQSIWTIDLCYILKRFNIKHEFNTCTIGVDPRLWSNEYYKLILSKDIERVRKKFEIASFNGISCSKKTVNNDDILHHLQYNGPIIVLVNSALLDCSFCKKNKLTKEFKTFFPFRNNTKTTKYVGHFIVLCGYNLRQEIIYYQDPSVQINDICMTTFNELTESRTFDGTDEDIIFIFNRETSRPQRMNDKTVIIFNENQMTKK